MSVQSLSIARWDVREAVYLQRQEEAGGGFRSVDGRLVTWGYWESFATEGGRDLQSKQIVRRMLFHDKETRFTHSDMFVLTESSYDRVLITRHVLRCRYPGLTLNDARDNLR